MSIPNNAANTSRRLGGDAVRAEIGRLTTELAPQLAAAEARIRPFIRRTCLEPSPYYSAIGGNNLFLKCENLQHTGSFKARGALSKVLALTPAERARGVVTASTGNHGAAVAYALQQVGAQGIVFVPEDAAATKVANIERLGASIRRQPGDPVEAEKAARQYAAANGMSYVPPYNDLDVVSGQGTIGLELVAELERVDAVFVGLGGGGLISGIAAAVKAAHPDAHIIGCSPANSQVMIQSVQAGQLLDLPSLPTLSDGTAGGVELDSITFPLIQGLVDAFVTVPEAAIAAELRTFLEIHHMLIEGAAAMTLAAYRQVAAEFAGQNIVVVLCGANISLATLRQVLNETE